MIGFEMGHISTKTSCYQQATPNLLNLTTMSKAHERDEKTPTVKANMLFK